MKTLSGTRGLIIKLPVSKPTDRLQKDRKRTNILAFIEQPGLLYLCRCMPAWVTPDLLTATGLFGSVIVALGLALAKNNYYFLILSLVGFTIQWFGDSLDGRLAYYRQTPRKWYGFALDICVDWISTSIIGLGFYYFLPDQNKVLAFTLAIAFGWAMVMALVKYKITDRYMIDNGLLGPTEFRLILCAGILLEIIWPGTLVVFAVIVNVLLVLVNINEFTSLLQFGNERDKDERNVIN